MSASKPRARGRSRFLAPVPLLILLLLDLSFNAYFWRIPKLTRRSVDWGYQFLVDAHRLAAPKAPDQIRVVVAGSSICSSLDPAQVRGLLHAALPAVDVDIRRLLLPGIKPSDYRIFFAAEQEKIHADVVVLPLNLFDFLNPSFERPVKAQVRYVLPPARTLWERHAFVPGVSAKLDLALASVSNLYRYRKALRSAVQDHAKFAVQWAVQRPPGTYGLYADRFTKRQFGLPIDGASRGEFEYFVHPDWIQQRGRITVTIETDERESQVYTADDSGWKTAHLPAGIRRIDVIADSTWTPRASGANDDVRQLAVQLRRIPSVPAKDGPLPLRYPPIDEPPPILRMGTAVGDEYVEQWQRVLQSDTRAGRRFRAYQELTLRLREQPFERGGEYEELSRLVNDLVDHGARVVLVNSPEHPLVLRQLANCPYYREHVEFLRSLAARTPHVRFADLGEALPLEDFNDWQHVNYIGTIKIGPRWAELLQQALTDDPPSKSLNR